MLAELELSMRTCRNRRRTLIMLASLTEATPRALAQAVGIDPKRLLGIMQGDGKDYSFERSLPALGLAEARLTERMTRIYVITDRGRRKARQLMARDARAAIAEAANARRDTTPWNGPLPPEPAPPTAVATASFAWSVACGHT